MSSIVFCGFGSLGQECLDTLLNHRYNISYIFTHKENDKNSVDTFAENNGIPYSYIDMRKDLTGVKDIFRYYNPDYLVSVNYRYIIPKVIFEIPAFSFNIHGSLLPSYRGRTPHVWSIIHGETKAGVTSHLLEETVDTGDIIEQWEVPIGKEDTGFQLLKKYERLYPDLLIESLDKLKNGSTLLIQDETMASFYGKRTPDMGYIDFRKTGEEVCDFVRAQATPYPGAYYYLKDGRKIIINKIEITGSTPTGLSPIGVIYNVHETLYVNCKDSCLKVVSYEIRKG